MSDDANEGCRYLFMARAVSGKERRKVLIVHGMGIDRIEAQYLILGNDQHKDADMARLGEMVCRSLEIVIDLTDPAGKGGSIVDRRIIRNDPVASLRCPAHQGEVTVSL